MSIGLQVKESLSGEEVERLSGVTRKYVGWIGFLALRNGWDGVAKACCKFARFVEFVKIRVLRRGASIRISSAWTCSFLV